MATNADNRCPTPRGRSAPQYPVTTPRDSSLRTRDWTAETDNPALRPSSDNVARPSATSRAHQDPVDVVERPQPWPRVSQRWSPLSSRGKRRRTCAAAGALRRRPVRHVRQRGARLHHAGRGQLPGQPGLRPCVPGAERLGSLSRVTAERHGAIRVGTPDELAAVADLFSAFGMVPGRLLRPARRRFAGSGGVYRVSADRRERVGANPFRVFTSMLAHQDPAFLRRRPARSCTDVSGSRQLFDPALIDRARVIAADGARRRPRPMTLSRGRGGVRAVA